MSRHFCCLTFDFDAMSGFVARGMVTPTPVSRGEFGAVGARRVLALLAEHEIRSTWFIPGVVIGTYPEVCREIVAAGHEIAHHGWTHVPPADMERSVEADGIVRGCDAIEALCGKRPRGYRSPSWDLSPHTIEMLLENGFVYDSSMMGHDYVPYRVRLGDVVEPDGPMQFGPETDLVEMPVSWSLDDYPHFEFVRTPSAILPGLAPARGVLENWIDDYRYMCQEIEWGVITYTFHPLVIGRGHRMLALRALIEHISADDPVFVTLEEAAAAWEERQ